MNGEEKIVKHLEMIQGVVNRLGHDSFLVKGWSMTLLAAAMIFIARNEISSEYLILLFALPVIAFWILDGYFLWQERLFRHIYNDCRKKDTTDFEMNPMKHIDKPKARWRAATFSITLNIFYGAQLLLVLAIFFLLW